ncbi:beta-ketoacyl-ACP reductase [Alphaproteobacteria bacterium]|nr:beta-ketoacyl-ACP reductase [Alphaproteobacteria bacterium]GHS98923.1 beta-ketoacyl-ACP reductase [Alphaproteobacteria bacterium]
MADIRTALVTGATGDIGLAITKALIRDGFQHIALSGLEEDILQTMVADLSTESCSLVSFPVDLLNAEEADSLFTKVSEALGPIGALINNAGITKDNLILRMSDNDWNLVLKLNLEACFRLCRASARSFLAQRFGRIVNISSVVGFSGNPGQVNYCASKAGLVGMSKALALELGSRGITVNCVAPGFISSAMTRVLTDAVKEKLLSNVPLGRMGLPEEVADAVAFLVSTRASYITGTTLHVNGGLYLM